MVSKTVSAFSALVVGLAASALAGCTGTDPSEPPAPQTTPPPQVTVPAFSEDDGCAKTTGLDHCLPWVQPQPATASWPQIVSVRGHQEKWVPVGPAYLCGLVREADLYQLAGPEAVKVLDGPACVLASTDGPQWVSAEQGQVQARLQFVGEQSVSRPTTSIAGRPAALDQTSDEPNHTHRSGLITASDGTPLRVSVDVTAPEAAPDAPRWKPDPDRATAQWTTLASHVAAATNR